VTATLKRVVFWGTTLLVPIAILTLAEVLLRATGVLAPEPLCVEVAETQGALLKFNPWVTRRYFDTSYVTLPNLAPEVFTRVKPPSTFRILCLGESTTAGFPFEGSVPFPVQLRELLGRAYPRRRIEVLNAGISAISSYVVVDMLPELLEQTNPDLVVVYLGHNEFYGIYGSGSTLFPGKKRTLVNLTLRLQHLHIVQGVKRLVQALKARPSAGSDSRTLMQAVVGNQDIGYKSEEYRKTMGAFRANLETITDRCLDRGVPVLLSTLVSNYRDQPPFHSLELSSHDSLAAAHLRAALAEADSLLAARDPDRAEDRYREALRVDSNNADAWYGAARARLLRGDSTGALSWYVGAKDRDAMRFRASEDANAIIESIAASRKTECVDMVGKFRRLSPGGVIGANLMCDHLHPTPQGYYQMAEAFYESIVAKGILPPPDGRFVAPLGPYGVTDLDWEIGLIKVFPMLHDWPFKHHDITRGEYRSHGDTAATRVALQRYRAGFAWARAHDIMGHLYLQRGNLERAREEYRAVAVYQPDDPWPHLQIAGLYEAEENWPLRSAALQAALIRSPVKGMIAYQLGLSKWKEGDFKKAIEAMEFASGAPEFTPEQQMNARFYLAGFLSDGGHPEESIKILRAILSENPSFEPARQFLFRLEGRTK
jgi:tetratricopeptide (TPR) repeat protein